MSADVQMAKNFLLTTDFPLDKVIYLASGSFNMGAGSSGTTTVEHNLPFTPLAGGSWSIDPSFSVSYEYGSGTFPSESPTTSIFNQLLEVSANDTDIIIGYENNSASPITAYYRLFGLEPADSFAEVPPTASSGDPFVLNTDYNYTKLYIGGQIDPLASPSTNVIEHNLGYLPQVMAWETDILGNRRPVDITDLPLFSFTSIEVNASSVIINVPALSIIERVDYRIYLDENA